MSDLIWTIIGVLGGAGFFIYMIIRARFNVKQVEKLKEEREVIEEEIKKEQEKINQMKPDEKINKFNESLNKFKEGEKR